MSRQPSPGVEGSSASNGGGSSHVFHQGMGASVHSSSRGKSRAYASGVAAGAEDAKYVAKYKDLKRKVRDIETDNDKLLIKILMAKRNIQRARLERAVLYERLLAIPEIQAGVPVQLPPQEKGPNPIPSSSKLPYHYQHHSGAHSGPTPGVVTVQTRRGPLQVLSGPDGLPLVGPDDKYIPALIPAMADIAGNPIGPFPVPMDARVSGQSHHGQQLSREPSSSSSNQIHMQHHQIAPAYAAPAHIEPAPIQHSRVHEQPPAPAPAPKTRTRASHSTRGRGRGAKARERERQQQLQEQEHEWQRQQHLAEQARMMEIETQPHYVEQPQPSRRLNIIQLSGHGEDPSQRSSPGFVPSISQHRSIHISPPSPPPMAPRPIPERRIHNHQRIGPGANINQRDPITKAVPSRIPTPPFARPPMEQKVERERDTSLSRNATPSEYHAPPRSQPQSPVHEMSHRRSHGSESRRSGGSRLSDLVNPQPQPPESSMRTQITGALGLTTTDSNNQYHWHSRMADSMEIDNESFSRRRMPDSDDEDEIYVAEGGDHSMSADRGPGYAPSTTGRPRGFEPNEQSAVSGSFQGRSNRRLVADDGGGGAGLRGLPVGPSQTQKAHQPHSSAMDTDDHAAEEDVQYHSVGELHPEGADMSGGGADGPITGRTQSHPSHAQPSPPSLSPQ